MERDPGGNPHEPGDAFAQAPNEGSADSMVRQSPRRDDVDVRDRVNVRVIIDRGMLLRLCAAADPRDHEAQHVATLLRTAAANPDNYVRG